MRVDAANLCHPLGRGLLHHRLQGLKTLGVRGNIGWLRPAFTQHQVQQAMEQHHVRARLQRQVQIRQFGRVGAARIGDDDFQIRVGFFRVFNAAKQNGVRPGRVAADNENASGLRNVVVTSGRRVGAQGHFVAGHGAAHAQARVAVDVVRAQQSFDQFVENVIVLGQQLA